MAEVALQTADLKAKTMRTFLTFSVLCAVALSALAQDIATKDLAARLEVRPIQTLTLRDEQFLTGDKNGPTVTVAGVLRIPQGSATRRWPVVIMLHGSGGPNPSNEVWGDYLNAMGVAAFLVDSWSGRGLVSTAANQELAPRFVQAMDLYRAYDVVATHPRIDPERIAVMGSSRGAQSVMATTLKRLQKMWNPNFKPVAFIPLYGTCGTTLIGETEVIPAPIRHFHGSADDFAPVAPCRDYYARLKAAGIDATLTEFPNVWHQFDNPLGNAKPTADAASQTTRNCRIKEEPMGVLINAVSGRPFTFKDPCVEYGPSRAYDAAATLATEKAVKELLTAVFKLN
jgi:dienelactone hydrolase